MTDQSSGERGATLDDLTQPRWVTYKEIAADGTQSEAALRSALSSAALDLAALLAKLETGGVASTPHDGVGRRGNDRRAPVSNEQIVDLLLAVARPDSYEDSPERKVAWDEIKRLDAKRVKLMVQCDWQNAEIERLRRCLKREQDLGNTLSAQRDQQQEALRQIADYEVGPGAFYEEGGVSIAVVSRLRDIARSALFSTEQAGS